MGEVGCRLLERKFTGVPANYLINKKKNQKQKRNLKQEDRFLSSNLHPTSPMILSPSILQS